jgi:hypothetical protein
MDDRGPFLQWQWSNYPGTHRNRRNLALHLASWPVFLAGTCALVASPFAGAGTAVVGVLALGAVVAAQARGHRLEEREPAAFRGAGDKLKRLFVEQWVTFPRYLMTGEFARAWREATTSIEDPRRPGPA